MKILTIVLFSMIFSCFMANNSFALIYTVDVDQDTDAAYSTQWPGASQSNQGANPEIG